MVISDKDTVVKSPHPNFLEHVSDEFLSYIIGRNTRSLSQNDNARFGGSESLRAGPVRTFHDVFPARSIRRILNAPEGPLSFQPMPELNSILTSSGAESLRLASRLAVHAPSVRNMKYANESRNDPEESEGSVRPISPIPDPIPRNGITISAIVDSKAAEQMDVLRAVSAQMTTEEPTDDNFDPSNFDPTNLSFKESCKKLTRCNIHKHMKLVRDTVVKYSLNISGLSGCCEEDLMIAVFLLLEDKLNIVAGLELCIRHDERSILQNLVGVVFDSIQTKEEVLNKAHLLKSEKIRVLHNGMSQWIFDGLRG